MRCYQSPQNEDELQYFVSTNTELQSYIIGWNYLV